MPAKKWLQTKEQKRKNRLARIKWEKKYPEKYAASRKRTSETSKQRYRDDPQFREKRRLESITKRRKKRFKLLEIFNSCCVKCGFSDWRALQIDHLLSNGSQERRELTLDGISKKILSMEDPKSEYQLLCANCNRIKQHENKEFGGAKRIPIDQLKGK